MTDTLNWVLVFPENEIDEEEVAEFKHENKSYAIYHLSSGFYATDGHCSHEQVSLADGLVMDEIIECPKHSGEFHIPSGEATELPACINLKTYPVKIEDGNIFIGLAT